MGKQETIFRLRLGFLLAQPPLTKRPVRCGTHTPCSAAPPSPPSARHLLLAGRGASPAGAARSLSRPRAGAVASPPSPVPSRPVPRSPRRAALPLPPLLKWQLPLICHIPWLGSPSLRLLPRPCSPAPLAKIEKGQHLSILAERLGGDPAFLPRFPFSGSVIGSGQRETLTACGGKGHRHASCSAGARAGASPSGSLSSLPSRQQRWGSQHP